MSRAVGDVSRQGLREPVRVDGPAAHDAHNPTRASAAAEGGRNGQRARSLHNDPCTGREHANGGCRIHQRDGASVADERARNNYRSPGDRL